MILQVGYSSSQHSTAKYCYITALFWYVCFVLNLKTECPNEFVPEINLSKNISFSLKYKVGLTISNLKS